MKKLALSVAILGTLLVTNTVMAYPFNPLTVADALIEANDFIKQHPNAPQGYFFLGGAEGAAWAFGLSDKSQRLDTDCFYPQCQFPSFCPWFSIRFKRDPKLAVTPECLKSLGASIASYRKAVELDPKDSRYNLALAWALEEASKAKLSPTDAGSDAPIPPTEAEIKQCHSALESLKDNDPLLRGQAANTLSTLFPRNSEMILKARDADDQLKYRIDRILMLYWKSQAIACYRIAYRESVEGDLALKEYSPDGDHTVSVIAGNRLVELLRSLNEPVADEIKKIEESIKIIEAKPPKNFCYA